MIYFDNAATTGVKPVNVINAVNNALKNYSANPGRSGYEISLKTSEMIYRTRKKLSDFFGADGPENVVFTMNCTHSINCVLKGVLKKGDHAVVSSLEHNAVMRPLVKMGVNYSAAKVSLTDDGETLENFKKAIKPNTKLVFCTGASNVLGKTLPIEKIGKTCKEKGIYFGVDAAQTAGVIPINMKTQNVDFLCIAPHKGLYAPMGIGVLIARKNIFNTLIEGGTGTNSLEFVQPENLPERLESGTVNVPGIAGVLAGANFVEKQGIKSIYNHEMKLIQDLYSALKNNPKIQIYTPFPKENLYVPVLSFNYEGIPSDNFSQTLSSDNIAVRAGFHCAPSAHRQIGTLNGGAVRISLGYFNSWQEIAFFIKNLDKKGKKISKIY